MLRSGSNEVYEIGGWDDRIEKSCCVEMHQLYRCCNVSNEPIPKFKLNKQLIKQLIKQTHGFVAPDARAKARHSTDRERE